MHIGVVFFDGMDELDALAPFEVLSHGINKGASFSLSYYCLQAPRLITGNHGLKIQVDRSLDETHLPDLLVIPGGGWQACNPSGVRHEVEHGVLPALLKKAHEQGTILAAVCTGAMLVACSGLMAGRPAVTFAAAMDDLSQFGAQVINARVVDDGDIISAAGVTSGIDLGLWLIERFAGAEIACAVEAHMAYERRGTVWRR
jgi:transcriptional regulator GlxA family with amidase domain